MQKEELRREVRKAASKGASVEFKPSDSEMPYHCALRDISESGIGLLINKTSDIINHIKIGDVYPMKFHKGRVSPTPEQLMVEIRHISEPADGKPPGHFVVGLLILEKLGTE